MSEEEFQSAVFDELVKSSVDKELFARVEAQTFASIMAMANVEIMPPWLDGKLSQKVIEQRWNVGLVALACAVGRAMWVFGEGDKEEAERWMASFVNAAEDNFDGIVAHLYREAEAALDKDAKPPFAG